MSGNIQGYKVPRGCLMTSGAILLPIVTLCLGLAGVASTTQMGLAVLTSAALIAVFAASQRGNKA